MRLIALLSCALVTAGCASVRDSLTPSASVMKDDFDGATIVRQSPVSASGNISEGWHTLGFEWNQKTPDTVYIVAGTNGRVNVTEVAFNADGKVISQIQPASALTEYGSWSTRRFAMSWQDFLAIANAKSVKMRLVRINDYTVSSFGPDYPNALVNAKIPPFVTKVQELRSAPQSRR
jgi:hypothetical protein